MLLFITKKDGVLYIIWKKRFTLSSFYIITFVGNAGHLSFITTLLSTRMKYNRNLCICLCMTSLREKGFTIDMQISSTQQL